MRGEVVVTATMQDGGVIRELARTFGAFVDLVLGFRRDPECVRVEWEEARVARRAA